MSNDSELIKAIGIAQKAESQIQKSALNSFFDYVEYGYKAINNVVKIMGTIGQYTYNFIENLSKIGNKVIELISIINVPQISDERKKHLIESYSSWGEYGWTVLPFSAIGFFNDCPKTLEEADKIALKELNKENTQRLFNFLRNTKGVRKSDLEEAIFDFENKKYKSCAMVLYSIIDSKLIRLQKDEDRNPKNNNRFSGNTAANKLRKRIEQETDVESTLFLLLSHKNLFSCIDKMFEYGDDFKVQPALANRHFLDHGMLTKNVRRKDCIKLFLLLYNFSEYIEIIKS